MLLTLLLSLIVIVSIFLILLIAVGLIQDKRLFITAPKDIRAAALEHKERFPGARILGWKLALICLFAIFGALFYGGLDGARRGFTFWQFFLRFITMLYLWKAFDIIFLDWLLKTHFFQHFYPETEGCEGYHSFGFNRKGQLIRIAVFPLVAAALAGICMLS